MAKLIVNAVIILCYIKFLLKGLEREILLLALKKQTAMLSTAYGKGHKAGSSVWPLKSESRL